MLAETVNEPVGLACRAVLLSQFANCMRVTPKAYALLAVFYVRTELQFRLKWCMVGLTKGEYDSEVRKRSKGEKVILMMHPIDWMT